VRLVARHAFGLAFAGLLLGLVAAAAGAQLLSAVLFGVRPLDPLSYVGAAAIIAAIVIVASWEPTRRALLPSTHALIAAPLSSTMSL